MFTTAVTVLMDTHTRIIMSTQEETTYCILLFYWERFLSWEIRVAFHEETQLQQSGAT